MAFFSAASKADFQQQLQTALAQHVDPKILPQLNLFAEQFFGIVALPELTERRMSDWLARRWPAGGCSSASTRRAGSAGLQSRL